MRVGELASRAGVTRKAIRVYEAAGILRPASRTAAGYREYDKSAVGVLAFVAGAQRLGFALADIARIVRIRRSGRPPCGQMRTILSTKLAELKDKRRTLETVEADIRRTLRAWNRRGCHDAAVCPKIEALSNAQARRNGSWTGRNSPFALRAPRARMSRSSAPTSASERPATSPSSTKRNGMFSST